MDYVVWNCERAGIVGFSYVKLVGYTVWSWQCCHLVCPHVNNRLYHVKFTFCWRRRYFSCEFYGLTCVKLTKAVGCHLTFVTKFVIWSFASASDEPYVLGTCSLFGTCSLSGTYSLLGARSLFGTCSLSGTCSLLGTCCLFGTCSLLGTCCVLSTCSVLGTCNVEVIGCD